MQIYHIQLLRHHHYFINYNERSITPKVTLEGNSTAFYISSPGFNLLYVVERLLYADKVKTNIVLVHSGADERVPIIHAEMMRAALIEAGNPPEWLSFDRKGHGFHDPERKAKLYEHMEVFLNKNIGAKKPGHSSYKTVEVNNAGSL